jgi:hypothetical protein
MRVSRLVVLVAALLAGPLFLQSQKAQGQPLTTPVNVAPDCLIFFDFTADAVSASFDNRFIGCKTWYVAYTSTGFPALTLTFQSAPDNGGVAGAWGAFGGAVVEGVNPNVAVTQASTIMYGYFPWQRIALTGSVAGAGRRIRGTFYGYRQVPVSTVILSGLSTVTANQGTPAVQANRWPVQLSDGANPQGLVANPLFTRLSDGTNPFGTTTNPLYTAASPTCTNKATVTLTGAGAAQVVALSAGKSIKVCHLSLSAESPVDVQLVEGTGANCVTGPANVTGLYRSVLGMALDFGVSPLTGSASQALCISLGTAVNVGGVLTYAQN